MGLYPTQVREYLAGKIPFGPLSQIYLFDPVNGVAGNNGLSFEKPLKTLTAAAALQTSDQHDTACMLASDAQDEPAAIVVWNKDHTHLIGLSGDLPGMGQRCRVVGTAALDLVRLLTLSGSGCIFKNLKFSNEGDAATALGAVLVSGDRNYFKNVMFAGMAHATPAAEALGYSLTVSGEENYFEDCTIGLDTIVRGAANAELILSGKRNHFRRCIFQSNSVTAAKVLVRVDNSGGDLRYNIFEDCLFWNYTENWATGIDNVFDMPAAGATHTIIMWGKNEFHGQISGWADTLTHIKGGAPATGAGFGVAVSPTG
jgi:hypothetical protein